MTAPPNPIEDADERAAYLALAVSPRLADVQLDNVLAACGTWIGALEAPIAFLGSCGLSTHAANAIKAASIARGREIELAAKAAGATIILKGDAAYPTRLLDLESPPRALFCRGNLKLLNQAGVAVVGSREHTGYGVAACRMVVASAIRADLVIVSGMARGIDAVAHRCALEYGKPTIGVLGTGIDVIYPRQNRALHQAMIERGLLITEFPPASPAFKRHFPWRNRIIARLGLLTVIVEAGERSGAATTGQATLDQGGEVLAVPGPINAPTSVGCNRLIRDGAAPFLEPHDLWDRIPQLRGARLASLPDAPPHLPDDLEEPQLLVAGIIGTGTPDIDTIAARIELPVEDVASILLHLEIRGVVVSLSGRRYGLARG